MNAFKVEFTSKDFDNYLDDVMPRWEGYYASDVFKSVDPIAYEIGLQEFIDDHESWTCDECGAIYSDEYDANECCFVEEDEEVEDD